MNEPDQHAPQYDYPKGSVGEFQQSLARVKAGLNLIRDNSPTARGYLSSIAELLHATPAMLSIRAGLADKLASIDESLARNEAWARGFDGKMKEAVDLLNEVWPKSNEQ